MDSEVVLMVCGQNKQHFIILRFENHSLILSFPHYQYRPNNQSINQLSQSRQLLFIIYY